MILRTTNSPLISNHCLALVLLVAMTACEPSTSSSTHWLTCQVASDCVAPGATGCSNGYCVDASGHRIDSSTQAPAGGGATSSADPIGGNSARGGTAAGIGGAGVGGAGVGGVAVSTGGATSASAGSAGAAGVCSSFDSAFIDSVKSCNTDGDCVKVQYQVNCCGTTAWTGIAANKAGAWSACIATRPAFAMCGCASTAPTTDDGRFVSYSGTEAGVSCIANKCQTRVVARSCGLTNPTTCNPDQVCVSYETLVGPSSTIDYACVTDPCTSKLDCTCGKSVCDQRTDRLRTCNIPISVGTTIFVDIACQDTAQ